MDVGPAELVIALVIILLLFGPSQLPRTARAIGQSVTELRRGMSGAPDPPDAPEPSPSPAEASAGAPEVSASAVEPGEVHR